MTSDQIARRKLIGTLVGLSVGGLGYFLTLFDYRLDLLRTAVAPGYFSGFFDAQARALLHGHVDMPPDVLGIEGFIHGGKYYTYFPPFPALLRLPVLLTTHEYDGKLTALSMALAWIVLAVVVSRLVWFLVPVLSGTTELRWPTVGLVAAFIAAATGGTVLTFDASLPWVYHEVYVWAVTSAIGACYWMVRVAFDATPSNIRWLCVFAFMCVGTRSTEGWAVCLMVIAMAVWMRWKPRSALHRRWWWFALLAGAVPLLCGIALNLYKFDNIYMFPLKDQVWTQVNAQRRAALAANGGSLTGAQFFTTSFMAYLRPDGIRFVDYFPWITLPAHAPRAYSGAFYDQAYRTGSVPAFMPLLMVMELVTVVLVLRPGARAQLRALRFPVIASILITGGVMGYGYYANRYTSEFVPALVFGGAVGTALLAGLLDRRPRLTAPALGIVSVAAVFSILAQMAIGYAEIATNHRGEPLKAYVDRQLEHSPAAQARLVTQVDGQPTGGRTDQLAIRGDCDALYLNTGDLYEPWVSVEERDKVLRISPTRSGLRPGSARLLTVSGGSGLWVEVEVNQLRQLRFVVHNGDGVGRGSWITMPTEDGLRLGIRNLTDVNFYEFSTVPGGTVGYLPSQYFDDRWNSIPAHVSLDSSALHALGLTVANEKALPLPLCEAVAANAGITLPGN